MKQRMRHLLSVLLACVMVLSLLPISALADEPETPPTTVIEPVGDPAPEPEPEPDPAPAQTIYVSNEGDDISGIGDKNAPYASLAKAVKEINSMDGTHFVIEVQSDLTATECARITDKNVTIRGNGHTITRGDGFATISDTSRSWYNPAIIEVTTPTEQGASLTLENITLDDAGKHMGTIFAQDPPKDASREECVQDAIVAAYGTNDATAEIILGNGANLKNYGGLSAVRITNGGYLTMEAGSAIYDDTVTSRTEPIGASGAGRYGAVFVQGTHFEMQKGASIGTETHGLVGRALFVETAKGYYKNATATINGTIQNVNHSAAVASCFKNSGNGSAMYLWAEWASDNNRQSEVTLGETGRITNIVGDQQGNNTGAIHVQNSRFEAMDKSVISGIKTTLAIYANDSYHRYGGGVYLNGTVKECESDVLFRPRLSDFTLGQSGLVTANQCGTCVFYSTDGANYIIQGTITKNKANRVFFVVRHGNVDAALTIEDGANISYNEIKNYYGAVYISNASDLVMTGGKIANNTGYGVEINGSANAVTFEMNGGEITGNTGGGIKYSIGDSSIVSLNAGKISNNGTFAAISASGGSAKDANENIYIAPGVLQENTTISTSFGTMTFDETYPALWLGQASTTAKDTIKTLVQATSGQETWNVKGNPLWFKATSDSLHFSVNRPFSVDKGIGLYAGYIPLNADGTPAYGATLTLVPLVNSDTIDVTLTNLAPGTSYALSFVVTDKYYITVNPADITVYMGGEHGSDGVVNGGQIVGSNSLPEPGFVFDLPKGITDISKITFQATDPADKKTWTIVPYDGNYNHEVYKIVPAEGQDPLRVEFTDPDTGLTVVSDNFSVGSAVNKTFDMGIYKGAVGTVEAVVTGDTSGTTYGIILNTGKLHVRGTTNKVQYADLNQTAVSGKPAISAGEGTTFTINNSDVVANKEGIALLFDNIIESTSSESNRTQLLQQKTDETINKPVSSGMVRNYDLKYLDLVDTLNGNTWVTASNDVTVSWPYPAGTDKNTEFTLLHFEGLHRDMASNEIAGDISECKVSEVEIEKGETHITFTIGQGGFSPFALVWETTSSGGTGTGTRDDYTLHYVTNGGKHLSSETKSSSWTKDYEDLPIPVRDGYTFEGWYWDLRLTEPVTGDVKVDKTTVSLYAKWSGGKDYGPDDTGVSNWLETDEHNAFLSGYPDGSFLADKNMTRAEVAQMFYSLLLDKNVTITKSFSDVPSDAWYAKAVNTLSSLGMLGGYPDGTFRPDAPITRAEFAAIALAFAYDPASASYSYTDVRANAWYYTYVAQATTYGWIGGYPDGSFRPNNSITRAEVAVIVNNMLGRDADESYIDRNAGKLVSFVDLSKNHWAYYTIMEATNSHDYTTSSNGESWKA